VKKTLSAFYGPNCDRSGLVDDSHVFCEVLDIPNQLVQSLSPLRVIFQAKHWSLRKFQKSHSPQNTRQPLANCGL